MRVRVFSSASSKLRASIVMARAPFLRVARRVSLISPRFLIRPFPIVR